MPDKSPGSQATSQRRAKARGAGRQAQHKPCELHRSLAGCPGERSTLYRRRWPRTASHAGLRHTLGEWGGTRGRQACTNTCAGKTASQPGSSTITDQPAKSSPRLVHSTGFLTVPPFRACFPSPPSPPYHPPSLHPPATALLTTSPTYSTTKEPRWMGVPANIPQPWVALLCCGEGGRERGK